MKNNKKLLTNDNIDAITMVKIAIGERNMKKGIKRVLIVLSILLATGVIFHFAVIDVTYYGNIAIKKFYYLYPTDDDVMSNKEELLKELGDYDKYKLNMRIRNLLWFTSYGLTLVGEYSEEKYNEQKEFIYANYKFATKNDKNIFKYDLDNLCAFEFDINKWHFKLLKKSAEGKEDNYDYYIPEDFRIIGFNDEDNKIAYLTFIDSDMDVFGDYNNEADLQEFVNYYFRYNFKK